MRRALVAVFSLMPLFALQPAIHAQAEEGVVITDHYASIGPTTEFWENGSMGGAFVLIGYPADDLTVHINWFGTLYDDDGSVVLQSFDYDVHWEMDPALLEPSVDLNYEVRGLAKARLRWVQEGTACMIYPDCDHTVVIKARWKGYGPIIGSGCDLVTGEGYVQSRRAARVKGRLTVDGLRVPGGDLGGVGQLVLNRYCTST